MPDAVPAITVAPIGVVRGRSEISRITGARSSHGSSWTRPCWTPTLPSGWTASPTSRRSSISIRPPTHAGVRRTRPATPRGLRSVFWPGTGRCGRTTSAFPVALLAVDGLQLTVRGLDAIDGTPVLDIKPYATEYNPRGPIREPAWMRELMRGYF